MSTIKNKDFNYEAFVQENSPTTTRIQRGTEARKQRFEAAILKYAIRIDEDILEQFQKLTPEGQGSEKLINQALRERLSAKDFKETARAELQQLVQKALLTITSSVEHSKAKRKKPLAVEES
ncbi:MAG: hypothetical protein ONB32_16595 [candidate division KSB1 bacterium]|nr:hypothetical protein [candidate division KSB1 bacterium]MDZ7341130.1 hypothetical protein [candidate division KSB1 bacterium]